MPLEVSGSLFGIQNSLLFIIDYNHIGPFVNREIDKDNEIRRVGSSLWEEETSCLSWLDTKPPNSVIYLNFGSLTVMTKEQFVEFAWGLAMSEKPFLWVIRSDLVVREAAVLPPEFLTETADRGVLASWCPQEKVLSHAAIGGFLTHSGWNSTMESISGVVPVICWPFFGDQNTNCKVSRDDWGIGTEICGEVKKEAVETVIRELMDGDKGKKMREKAEQWRLFI